MPDSQYTITFHYMYAEEKGIPSGHTSFTLTEKGGGGDEASVTFEASSSGGGPSTWINPFDDGKDGYAGVADPNLDPTNPDFTGDVVSETLDLTPEQFNDALNTINNITNGNVREPVNYNLFSGLPFGPDGQYSCFSFANEIYKSIGGTGDFIDLFSKSDLNKIDTTLIGIYYGTLNDLEGYGEQFADQINDLLKDVSDVGAKIRDLINDFFRDPLVLDLDGDGIELVAQADSLAFFDMDSDGFAENTGWVSGDDGMLVLDGNGDGVVNDLSELVGSGFVSPTASTDNLNDGPTGFQELASFDLNIDGVIDANDTVYSQLQVWRDLNQDGISSAHELFTLADVGVTSIDLGFTTLVPNPGDSLDVLNGSGVSGNVITQKGSFTRSDGTTGTVADVWLSYDPAVTRANEQIKWDPDTLDMPALLGYGEVLDLSPAMSKDPLLKEMVAELQNLTIAEAHTYATKVEAMIMQWAGVADVGAQSRGQYTNGQYLTAVEKFSGFGYLQIGRFSDPYPVAGSSIIGNFKQLQSQVMTALLPQISLGAEIMPQLSGFYGAFLDLQDGTTLSGLLADMEANAPADPGARVEYWNTMTLLVHGVKDQLPEPDSEIAVAFNEVFETQSLGLTYDQVRSAMIGGTGDDALVGTTDGTGSDAFPISRDNVLYGGAGDDLLMGSSGADIYLFGYGSGNDEIRERFFQSVHGDRVFNNTVKFLPGVTADDVVFETAQGEAGQDMVIRLISTGETLTIKNQFNEGSPIVQSAGANIWSDAVKRGGALTNNPASILSAR